MKIFRETTAKEWFYLIISITLLLIFVSTTAQSADLRPYIQVSHLSISYEKAVLSNRSYYIPENEDPTKFLNLDLTIDIGKYLYFSQRVESIVGTSQFRYIGYRPELGIKTPFGIDLYVRHFSGHGLDFEGNQRFPEENTIGVRFVFIDF